MQWSEVFNVRYLIARFKEPSTWGSLGALLLAVGVLSQGAYQKWVLIIGGLSSMLGMAMPEKQSPPMQPPSNAEEKPEVTSTTSTAPPGDEERA